ncbi:putative deoxynucleotide monophosphate kinase [Chloriridovirus anopheles1]|uniref:Putative deoxynucleotide monophosphate kinase n=1 Tax=Chloriridovirus anopheles1 TaxID=1465751 RepID=W8R9U1_9VIRU|nr:putative deoxynucleotide monophosphate kinase [Anopheles minimus iridovirus]AHL67626.1 putative deoxynucleotide monophosphate kinase [Anopheles minimus iridovirus]
MVKIAFGYDRRVGKDTSCDYLLSKYGGIKLSFAAPLYDILGYAQKVCGFPRTKDRKFLQFIGTEWARHTNKNVWVDLLKNKVLENAHQNIFVSDLRFQNEFKVLKSLGFVCVRIVGDSKIASDGYSNHQSDNDLADCTDWDWVIENKGELQELCAKLDQVYKECVSTIFCQPV